jgi:hypothetical protein
LIACDKSIELAHCAELRRENYDPFKNESTLKRTAAAAKHNIEVVFNAFHEKHQKTTVTFMCNKKCVKMQHFAC